MIIESDKVAVIFPGQGSQSVAMLSDVASQFPLVNATFAEASEKLGYDLWQLVQCGPEEKLNKTEYTQPAMLAADVAAWRVCQTKSHSKPLFLAGHSLGEYAALVCAGALGFKDAIGLVAERGRMMQQAIPVGKGGMVAVIGLDQDKIDEVCKLASQGEILSPANYNSIGQTVIAGDIAAAERAVVIAKEHGAKIAKLLPVSVPAHCGLMKPAADDLAQLLQHIEFTTPHIEMINNVDVKSYNSSEAIRDALARQLYSPVRWVETIQFLQQQGIKSFIECGPGKVLFGLNKRIARDLTTVNFRELI